MVDRDQMVVGAVLERGATVPTDEPIVRDIMIRDVRTVLPQAPVIRAAQMMAKHQIRHLVVIDSLGPVVGVVTQRQILKHFSPWLTGADFETGGQASPPPLEVHQIMTTPAVTVTPNATIAAAARIFAKEKIGCLPVVEHGKRLAGIVTTIDVLRFVAGNRPVHSDEEFQVFMPPAFLNKDREFVLPTGYFPDTKLEESLLAVLSYAPASKRIGVRLLQNSQQPRQEMLGACPAVGTEKYVKIPAGDFVEHHHLNIRGPLEVTQTETSGYVILSPVLSPTFHGGADHAQSE